VSADQEALDQGKPVSLAHRSDAEVVALVEAACAPEREPCVVCGKPCGKRPWLAHLIAGGDRFAQPGEEESDPAADVGWHAVGSECAKGLRAQGVELIRAPEEAS
jgi:hypothetical protein